MGRRLGLLIGVNNYQDTAFRPLKFAETDARALGQWLVNVKGGNWSPGDVQLVLGTQATSELTESLIAQLCVNNAGPGDLILIYFAGHAFLDEESGEGHLALTNTAYNRPRSGVNLLSMARFALSKSRASQILVILDCFQTGEVWSLRRASLYDSRPVLGPSLLNALQQRDGRMFLCSCRGNELAPEVGERNLGLLVHRTIVGLSGTARDHVSGQVTLQRLHAFLFNALGEQHRPQLFGQGSNQYVLVGDKPAASASAPAFSEREDFRPVASDTLAAQATLRTAVAAREMRSTTSGLLSLATAEQQRQQQVTTVLKQARQFIQLQKPAEAYQLVEQALQIEPANISALILKGQLLGMAGRFQEALATTEQVVRHDPKNALAWSMQAAILTNTGQFLDALSAVERSLKLEPGNPEALAIKSTILTSLAPSNGVTGGSQALSAYRSQGGPLSFLIGTGVQIFGLVIGIVGAGLLILQHGIPPFVALALESLGLAILCINAARGSYVYGAARFLLTLLTSLIAVGIVGGLYKFGYHKLLQEVIAHPSLLSPLLFLVFWLALAAVAPLLCAIGGLIGGAGRRTRKRR